MTSAQLRAARAYLDWTMDKAAAVSGLNRRTIIRGNVMPRFNRLVARSRILRGKAA